MPPHTQTCSFLVGLLCCGPHKYRDYIFHFFFKKAQCICKCRHCIIKYFPIRRQFGFCLGVDKNQSLCLQLLVPDDHKPFSQTHCASTPWEHLLHQMLLAPEPSDTALISQPLIPGVLVCSSLNDVSCRQTQCLLPPPDKCSSLGLLLTVSHWWCHSAGSSCTCIFRKSKQNKICF